MTEEETQAAEQIKLQEEHAALQVVLQERQGIAEGIAKDFEDKYKDEFAILADVDKDAHMVQTALTLKTAIGTILAPLVHTPTLADILVEGMRIDFAMLGYDIVKVVPEDEECD